MSESKTQTKGTRLGTQMRGELAEAFNQRGHMKSSLWLVYSPKAKRDVVLKSKLEFGHFLLVESDPDIERVNYAPQKRVVELYGEAIGTVLDAELVRRSGVVVWREVKSSEDLAVGAQGRANSQLMAQAKAAGMLNAVHEVLTEKEIFSQPQRILNWINILPWISQCQTVSLDDAKKNVLQLLRKRKEISFQQLKEHAGTEAYPFMAAALFSLVQNGFARSDLDTKPFTLRSRFFDRLE